MTTREARTIPTSPARGRSGSPGAFRSPTASIEVPRQPGLPLDQNYGQSAFPQGVSGG